MTRALTERGLHAAEIVRERECIGCLQCTDVCPDAALTIWEEPADG
jgi:NAD-dependent dihydropyrimidine dehydrogenase PreA subunit